MWSVFSMLDVECALLCGMFLFSHRSHRFAHTVRVDGPIPPIAPMARQMADFSNTNKN